MSVIANGVKQSHSFIIKVDFRKDNSNIEEILKKEYSVQAAVLYGAAAFSEDIDLWVEPCIKNYKNKQYFIYARYK